VDLAAGDGEVQGTAFIVDNGVDLRGLAAAADANRLLFLSPFPPLAQRCAFTIALSIKCEPIRDLAATWSKTCFQTPRRDQRLNRLYAVV
jgi:hypothetical protein